MSAKRLFETKPFRDASRLYHWEWLLELIREGRQQRNYGVFERTLHTPFQMPVDGFVSDSFRRSTVVLKQNEPEAKSFERLIAHAYLSCRSFIQQFIRELYVVFVEFEDAEAQADQGYTTNVPKRL